MSSPPQRSSSTAPPRASLGVDAPRGAAACAHCGQPLGNSLDAYCCQGCRAVAQVLSAASLERYYTLRSGTGTRPTLVDEARRDRLWLGPMCEAIAQSDGPHSVALDVSGMHCAGCVWVLEELFRREQGADGILVNPALGRCDLTVRRGFDLTHYVEGVERLGYLMGPPGKVAELGHDALVVRAGVTVALAMNAMIFGVAQYFGLTEEPLRTTIATLEVVLALAAVGVGAPTFFIAAWEGARRGVLHLDLPIAVGLTLSLVGTLVAFARTGDPSFADTLAVFVALMLVGRMIERGALERNRHRLLASEGTDGLFARVRGADGSASVVRASAIRAGDHLVIATGEVVPVDGVTRSAALVSLDWLDGESKPRDLDAGAPVRAGSINAARGPLEIVASSDLAHSALTDLLRREAPDESAQRARGLFHRVAAVWVLGVLGAAGATLAFFAARGELDVGMANATALLVVTCPCAIGIATPLAYQLAVGDLRRVGVLVRRTRTLDRLAQVDTLAFDKTGTLTTGRLRLSPASLASLATLSPERRAVLASLVAHSGHPKSEALRSALACAATDFVMEALEVEETVGAGLSAHARGALARLGRPSWALDAADQGHVPLDCDLAFTLDGRLVVALSTEEEIRHDARAELTALVRQGYRLAILSGDRTARVRRVARALGLEELQVPEADVLGDLRPEDKAEWLRARGGRALFVGDGINDSLAAEVAFVSATPAIERPFLPAKTDFVFVDAGIAPVRWALAASGRVRSASRRNLIFAVVYNVLGGALAVSGAFHPWVAAILMPSSSLFVVARTLLAFRRGVDVDAVAPAPARPRRSRGQSATHVASLATGSAP